MDSTINHISLTALSFALLPALMALYFLYSWSLDHKRAYYAIGRMLTQLFLIGYVLNYIFNTEHAELISAILLIMIGLSSWIALSVVKPYRRILLKYALTAIFCSSFLVITIISQGVLAVSPWYQPQVILPLSGMVFAAAMNSVSLSAERFIDEIQRDSSYYRARTQALKTASIPVINSLFAVGIVSLPGMMTGQILTGIAPHIAARYQIMVMMMLFSVTVLSAVLFLWLLKRNYQQLFNTNIDG